MPAGAGTPLTAPGGQAAPGLSAVYEWQNASTFVSFWCSLQQAYDAGAGLAAASALGANDRFLLWQSGVATRVTIGTLQAAFQPGGEFDLGYLEAPAVDLTSAGALSFGATASDVQVAKEATGTLAVKLGDGSGYAQLRVADSTPSAPSIYGAGSANNGLGFKGGTVVFPTGGTYRAAFTGTWNYGLALAGGDALSWVPGSDAYAGTADTQISRPAAGTVSLDTTGNADGLAKLKLGGIRFLGATSAAGLAGATQLPNASDLSIHKNTTTGFLYLAFNDGGTVKSVQLT